MPGPKTNEREGTRSVLRHARVSPYKVREVLDLVRNKPVAEAADILRFTERDAGILVAKVLHSAVANAQHNDSQDPEELFVSACFADEGTTIKRWRPRARGRATRIRKRTSHITIIVSRLPDSDIIRLHARQEADQAAHRARRVAGARKSTEDQGGRTRSLRRRGASETHDHDHDDHDHDHEETSALTAAIEAEATATEAPATTSATVPEAAEKAPDNAEKGE